MSLILVMGLCAFLLASGPSVAAEIAPTKFMTTNGITVLVLEQHFLPIVEIHALIKAGSAQDPPDKAGLANLVASLLDEGTTTRTSRQQAEQIDFVGGALEAKASEDFTTVSARVLKKDIDLGFTLLADMLQRPAFHKPEFERIRTQILGEMASDNDDPGHIAMKAFNQLVFHGHPYRWPVNGTEETLDKITLADVQAFYGQEYSPSQVILTIVGDVTLEQATALVQTHFGAWKKVASTARNMKKPSPVERRTVQLIEKDLTQSTIVLGHGGHPAHASGLLFRHSHELHPWGRRIFLALNGFDSRQAGIGLRDHEPLRCSADARFFLGQPSNQDGDDESSHHQRPVRDQIHSRYSRIRPGVGRSEIISRSAAFPYDLIPRRKLAHVLAQVELYGLGFEYFSDYPKWIDRVTKEDVQRVAKQYLDPKRYALVVVGNIAKAKVKL